MRAIPDLRGEGYLCAGLESSSRLWAGQGLRSDFILFFVRRLAGKLYVLCAVLVVVPSPVSWQRGSVSSTVGRIRQYSCFL